VKQCCPLYTQAFSNILKNKLMEITVKQIPEKNGKAMAEYNSYNKITTIE